MGHPNHSPHFAESLAMAAVPGTIKNTHSPPGPPGPAAYFRHHWMEPASIMTACLLATTALTTPFLATVLGAAALTAGSCYMLVKSSDALVHSAKTLGIKGKLSPVLLGLILGALTSMPEFAISTSAALQGAGGVSVGNIVGTNIGNILFILGLTAAVSAKPVTATGASWKFNAAAMLGVTALYGVGLATGSLGLYAGLGLLGIGATYMYSTFVREKDDELLARVKGDPAKTILPPPDGMMGFSRKQAVAYALAGIVGLVAASALMVTSATAFAAGIGVSPVLVSAVLVAIGTSLPELSIGIKAVRRGEMDLAIGNILGSNIFNILVVGGASAAIAAATGNPLIVPPEFTMDSAYGAFNLAAFAGSAGLLTFALAKGKGALTRAQGVAGMALYATFAAASVMLSSGVDQVEPVREPTAYEQAIPAPTHENAVIQGYQKTYGPV